MPTYEYKCRACGHHFERFQSMTAAHEKNCPSCGAEVERLLGAGAGFIMKGAGVSESAPIQCGKEQTCCGRTERCESPACHH